MTTTNIKADPTVRLAGLLPIPLDVNEIDACADNVIMGGAKLSECSSNVGKRLLGLVDWVNHQGEIRKSEAKKRTSERQ